MLGMYFDKRRPVANALASAGECILTFILTPTFQLLIDSFSWRGALLIMGGLQLNLCVCGMLLRPLSNTPKSTCVNEAKADEDGLSRKMLLKDILDEVKSSIQEEKELNTEEANQETSKKCFEDAEGGPSLAEDSASLRERDLRTKVQQYVDYTLITNPRFMIYSMFGVFAALGFFAPSLFLVPYARSKGIEEYQAAALMSISAVLDLIGRVVFGWVANLRLVETVCPTILYSDKHLHLL